MACIDMFTKLEKHVYEFYGKKYPEKGIIIRWIEKIKNNNNCKP